jgi:hypothetical protein
MNASDVDRRDNNRGPLRTTRAANHQGLIVANDRHPDLASISSE